MIRPAQSRRSRLERAIPVAHPRRRLRHQPERPREEATQFDGFAHQTHEDSLYNCFKMGDIATRTGFKKLGIEKAGALVTRGVMIDVAGYKSVDMLGDTYEITV